MKDDAERLAKQRAKQKRWEVRHPNYRREYNKLNAERIQQQNREQHKRKRARRKEELETTVGTICIECGEARIVQYHHPSGESNSLGRNRQSLGSMSTADFQKYLGEVIALCPTCHALRHHSART